MHFANAWQDLVFVFRSKLTVENLKEDYAPLAEAQWQDDKEVQSCQQRKKKKTNSRRRVSAKLNTI